MSNRQNRGRGVCLIYGVQPEVGIYEKVHEIVRKKVMWLDFCQELSNICIKWNTNRVKIQWNRKNWKNINVYKVSNTVFLVTVAMCIDDTHLLKKY